MELREIDIPIVELSVNTEIMPTSPSRMKTQPTNEDQQEAKSPKHTRNFPTRELSGLSHETERADATTFP
jgi:hypothetical protein